MPTSPTNEDAVPTATQALAQLAAIEAMLNLDFALPPNDKNQANALRRVTDTAIDLAAEIVSASPERFPDFADLPASAAYVRTLRQVAARASELAMHVEKSAQKQRSPAATKTLALYAVVKGLGRIVENETMREKVEALRAQVVPKRKNPKPRQTKGEKAVKRQAKSRTKRVQKAMKVLAAEGVGVPGGTSAPGGGTPAS
ncbi:MAG TPA: hypothetical protein VGI39_08715 [Polyangiaceae bacterium]